MATCRFPECGRPHAAAMLCDMHYRQQRRGQALAAIGTYRGGIAARPVADRFWEKVDRSQLSPGGCWPWLGTINRVNGYGYMGIIQPDKGQRPRSAHRLSWMIASGPIPSGLEVLHRCDVRHCVNPDHLFVGTQLDNIRDMHGKGRARPPRGEAHFRAKFTEAQVLEIRARRANGESGAVVASAYGTTTVTVSKIVRRLLWAHI